MARTNIASCGASCCYQSAISCRRNGDTVGRMTECLIAAVTICDRAAVLHLGADFTTLARHTSLQLAGPA